MGNFSRNFTRVKYLSDFGSSYFQPPNSEKKKHEHHLAQHSPSPNYTTLLRWRQLTSIYMLNIMLSPNSLDSFVVFFRAYTMPYALRWLNWTLYGFMDSNQFMAYDGKQKSRCRSIQKYLKGISWVWPLPINNHQDYDIFSREIPIDLHFATGTLGGGHTTQNRWMKYP